MKSPTPHNEAKRLAALREFDILDTANEREYDDVTLIAAQICDVPMATISLVDSNRQWFKSVVGIEARETPREYAFCAYAILSPEDILVVEDATKDPRFSDSPLVTTDPRIRFYAGVPLVSRDGYPLGALCVIDSKPRKLTVEQVSALKALARQLTLRLELRRTTCLLNEANKELKNLSVTDELTGLYNARGFLLHAEQQMKQFRSKRLDKGLWMMLCDMDGLKHINDNYGHPEGSWAIVQCAEVLSRTLRESDIIARPGGDEFTALILNTNDEVAERIPERLDAAFSEMNARSGKLFRVTMSAGLVKADADLDRTAADLIKRADEEMYRQKRQRKLAA